MTYLVSACDVVIRCRIGSSEHALRKPSTNSWRIQTVTSLPMPRTIRPCQCNDHDASPRLKCRSSWQLSLSHFPPFCFEDCERFERFGRASSDFSCFSLFLCRRGLFFDHNFDFPRPGICLRLLGVARNGSLPLGAV